MVRSYPNNMVCIWDINELQCNLHVTERQVNLHTSGYSFQNIYVVEGMIK